MSSDKQANTRQVRLHEARAKNVFSYHGKRSSNSQNTGRNTNQSEPHMGSKKGVAALAVVLIILAIGFSSTTNLSPRISIAQTDGSVQLPSGAYEQKVADILASSWQYRFKLLVSERAIEEKIVAEHPELSGVTVAVPLLTRKPVVTLAPAKTALILDTTTGSYYVGLDGKVLGEAAKLEKNGSTDVPRVVDESGLEITPGGYILNRDQTTFILHTYLGLKRLDYQVKSIRLPVTVNELAVALVGNSYEVRFNLLEDAAVGVGAYHAFVDEIRGKQQPTQYVDLRVPEKAFYR